MQENKEKISITFLGGGRVTQNVLRNASYTYFEHSEVLPECDINIVFPEGSITYSQIRDPLWWSEVNTNKLCFDILEEKNSTQSLLEKKLNESDVIISAFTNSNLGELTQKHKNPRSAETAQNATIAKRYTSLVNTPEKTWINVSNQSDVLGSIINSQFSKKNLDVNVLSFGLKLDQIRINSYLKNHHCDDNYIMREEYQNKIKVYGLHGRPVIITKDALEYMQKATIEKYPLEYQKVVQEEMGALNHLSSKPPEIMNKLRYIPDVEIGKEVFHLCLSEFGILENIQKNINLPTASLFRNPSNFGSRAVSSHDIIELYNNTLDVYLTNENFAPEIKEDILSNYKLKKLQNEREYLFFGGNFDEIKIDELPKNDKFMTAIGLIHYLKVNYDSVDIK